MVEEEKIVFLHVPKTGGAAMQYFFYEQLKTIRRNYFFSFSGHDDSRFFQDERATRRDAGNRRVVERLFADPEMAAHVRESPHFREAKLVFGHTTCAFGALFPEYRFRYLAVLREPVERTLSNIAQFSVPSPGGVTFAHCTTTAEKYSDEYWAFVYDILTREYPVPGLLVHENLYLRNCMTRVLDGGTYRDAREPANLLRALVGAQRTRISFYDEFNAGLQRGLDALGVPIDMSRNARAGEGAPPADMAKAAYGPYLNAPQRLIDFVAEQNQVDLELYDILRHRGWLAYQPSPPAPAVPMPAA